MSKRLLANSSKNFIAGDSITIADFSIAGYVYATYLNDLNKNNEPFAAIMVNLPELDAYFRGLSEPLKEYLETRPKYRG